ncbi:basic 7S globulin [Prunus yedoensis var. nudiflora]|uniref:Basic 7S globulin n=1 Tax=Prunus yedoensis var. nudiflora TaxID=2094558 RepID=A0A314YJ36_PRUYE|nr:basic 7S globulin [Prunus yedoensis var. nudiflora]
MAFSFIRILFTSLVLINTIITPSLAKTSFRPKALVLPVTKDASTLQYLTSIKQRTPLVSTRLTLDLGGDFLWVDCEQDFVSSTYKPSRCHSAQCSLAKAKDYYDCLSPQRPGCHNNTCELMPANTVLVSIRQL